VERAASIFSTLRETSSDAELTTLGSSQQQASEWIVNKDGAHICPDDPSLTQRYALAVLYYSTLGDKMWTNCTLATACTGGHPFLSAASECNWAGIECNRTSGAVTAISMTNYSMGGKLPSEIGKLSDLVELDLDKNQLSGSIPSILGELSALEIIDLDNNLLTGSIPQSLFSLTALRVLDLDGNKLSGTISPSIGALSDLYFVQLDFNQLVGDIPDAFSSMSSLTYLSLLGNDFTSTLPQDLCTKEKLTLYADCSVCTETEGCCTACLESTP
jgi:Leucine rich repeat